LALHRQHGANARRLIPGARYVVLEDVGHVAMLDDAQLVAQTILTAAATNLHDNTAPVRHGGARCSWLAAQTLCGSLQ
jgi:hypothetical protein